MKTNIKKKSNKKNINNNEFNKNKTKINQEVKHSFETEFKKFGLKKEIISSIEDLGFIKPSEIQEESIPLILEGNDLVGQAQTGTGKTAAFGLPLVEKIVGNRGVELLVIVPTRELAMQVSAELWKFGKNLFYKTATVFGGVSYQKQLDYIKKANILVATPGRLLDLLKTGKIDINPRFVVLDEADEMLNMGFIDDIKAIFNFIKNREQTLMFSATMPDEIKKLAFEILNKPKEVKIQAKTLSSENVEQYFYVLDDFRKDEALIQLLRLKNPKKIIIFSRTKKEVDRIARFLNFSGFRALALHGDVEQWKRQKILTDFKRNGSKILVATDVAARGIDIKNISHIINYHIPLNSEPYVHRIGRTGRAGEKGEAHTFVLKEEIVDLQKIEKEIKKKIAIGEILKDNDLYFIKNKILKEDNFNESEYLFKILQDEFYKNPELIFQKSLSLIVDLISQKEKISLGIEEIERILKNKKEFDNYEKYGRKGRDRGRKSAYSYIHKNNSRRNKKGFERSEKKIREKKKYTWK